MNKYVVSYRAEIREDLSDDLIHAGEVVDTNIFDYDESIVVSAEGFFECYIDACDELNDMYENKADIIITSPVPKSG